MNILVPVDGSTTAKRAAKFAIDMAKSDPSAEITDSRGSLPAYRC